MDIEPSMSCKNCEHYKIKCFPTVNIKTCKNFEFRKFNGRQYPTDEFLKDTQEFLQSTENFIKKVLTELYR